ncbi:MAG: hypothetical protein RBT67_13760 [Thauera sp.]|jgi:hypothetical protein|nr:hypothetical protein [Thauera sp.]
MTASTQTAVTASPADLMAKPAMSFEELFLGLLGLPESTAEELVRSPDAPKMFLLGRRRYIRTPDAVAWLDRMAEAKPYFPRRNNRRAA